MNDTLEKPHTREYLHLKEVALRLDGIWTQAQTHSDPTIASVRRDLNAQWDAEVTKLIATGSVRGTINAARVRLKKRKMLLSFLDD